MGWMKTGDVAASIGLNVTTEMLIELGFKPSPEPGRAKLWNEDDYPAMCDKLGDWVKKRKDVRNVKPSAAKKPTAAPTPPPPAPPPAADDEEL